MIASIKNRDDFEKAKQALQNTQTKRNDLTSESADLRKRVDTLQDEYSEALVQHELDEISEGELTEIKQQLNDAEQSLIAIEKRIEPLNKAVEKMQARFDEVVNKAIKDERRKVAAEHKKRLAKLIEAFDGLQEANEHLQSLNAEVDHPQLRVTSLMDLHPKQMGNGKGNPILAWSRKVKNYINN